MPGERSRRTMLRRIGTAIGGAGLLGAAGTASAADCAGSTYRGDSPWSAAIPVRRNADSMYFIVENSHKNGFHLEHLPRDGSYTNENRSQWIWAPGDGSVSFFAYNLHRGGSHVLRCDANARETNIRWFVMSSNCF